MFILLTGNPNSQKTQLLNLLKNNQYNTFNVDEFINEIYKVNQIGYILIQTHFGKEYTTNESVNKKKLKELILRDNYSLYKLKILIWPLIKSKLFYLKKRNNFMIVEMAIFKIDPLYFNNIFDYVIEISKDDINNKMKGFKQIYNNSHICYKPDIIIKNNDDIFITYNELEKTIKNINNNIDNKLN